MPTATIPPIRREPSMVRFAAQTSPTRRSLPQLPHRYRPELHRQATEKVPASRVGQELQLLWDRGLGEALDCPAQAKAREQATVLLSKLSLALKRNRVGLDILDPFPLQCFAHWHVTPETKVVCLLPVTFNKVKVIQKDAGHVALKLLPIPKPPTTVPGNLSGQSQGSPSVPKDSVPIADIRTKDGLHVSPRKLHSTVAKLVNSILSKHFPKYKIQCTLSGSDLGMWVTLDCGWTADLVPCVAASPFAADIDVYYVTRRFTSEQHVNHDITWRPCSAVRDHDVLRSITCTDQGLRVRSMHLVTRLLTRDWRLSFVTCHDVQTALLHDMDFQVDYSPRWQRCTLESSVTSLLKTLLYFVGRGSLPHFDLDRYNLWQHVTSQQMAQARSALNRLLSNEKALASLAKRSATDTASVQFAQS